MAPESGSMRASLSRRHHQMATPDRVRSHSEAQHSWRGRGINTDPCNVESRDGEEVVVGGARRRRCAQILPKPTVIGQLQRRLGHAVEFSSPAPDGNDVVVAGRSATTQCQNPEPVGASTSYIVTTNSPSPTESRTSSILENDPYHPERR